MMAAGLKRYIHGGSRWRTVCGSESIYLCMRPSVFFMISLPYDFSVLYYDGTYQWVGAHPVSALKCQLHGESHVVFSHNPLSFFLTEIKNPEYLKYSGYKKLHNNKKSLKCGYIPELIFYMP